MPQHTKSGPILQGQIRFVKAAPLPNGGSVGREIWSNRYAVVVSSNDINKRAGVVQVVYLNRSKRQRPDNTHIPLSVDGQNYTAVCNQVANVDVSRLRETITTIDTDTLNTILDGVASTFGLLNNQKAA